MKNQNLFYTQTILLVISVFVSQQLVASEFPAVDCVIQPDELVDLGSPVAGVIEDILVQRSDQVVKGQPVAKIEDSVERATVALARARAKVDAQLEIEQINMAYDKKSQERIGSLYGRKVIAIDNKDAADREAELSRLRLIQVRDLQAVRNRELERARELVDQKIIRSTIDGFVIEKFKSPGEFVEDQPIIRVARLDPLKVEALVPMSYFGKIQVGMLAEISPEIGTKSLRSAQVKVVDRVGDAASGTFGVQLELDNPEFLIPAGLNCEVKFLETPAEVLAEAQERERIRVSAQVNPGEVAEPKPNSSVAYVLGPFEQESALNDAFESVKPLTATQRDEYIDVVANYMVVASASSHSKTQALIKTGELRDYRLLNEAPYTNRYSLGIYNALARAQLRVEQLRSLGIESQAFPRVLQKRVWWIDVLVSAEQESDIQSLLNEGLPIHRLSQISGS